MPNRSFSCDEETVDSLNIYENEIYGEQSEEFARGQRVAPTKVSEASILTIEDFEDRIVKLESRVSELETLVNVLTRRVRALE